MEQVPTGKVYDINTFEQILNVVTPENLENFLADFSLFLGLYANSIKAVRGILPDKGQGLLNTDLALAGFVWTDDGINEMKAVTTTNTATGETTVIDVETAVNAIKDKMTGHEND